LERIPRSAKQKQVNSSSDVHQFAIGVAKKQMRLHVDQLSPAADGIFQPVIEIASAKPIKRLGKGSQWWFSETIHVPIGTKITFRFKGPTHLLVVYNEGARRAGETSVNGRHSSKLQSIGHKLTFVPAGSSYHESHETSSFTRVTYLYLKTTAFETCREGQDPIPPKIYFEDARVWETASRLKNAIESGHVECAPYLTALSSVLAHELSRVNVSITHQLERSRGGLASWQKRVVIDHVEKYLGQQVCLSELAQLTELSPYHFCRAFKQSFGVPPYQYRVQRRMEIAKSLLADRTASVTDIALSLGYARISAFSHAFRKVTGWAPTIYRREFMILSESTRRRRHVKQFQNSAKPTSLAGIAGRPGMPKAASDPPPPVAVRRT
jgi:AraC family transcriptional regulator